FITTIFEPKSRPNFEALRQKAIEAAKAADAFVKIQIVWSIGWEELHRGRIREARDAARNLMQIGRELNDPRSTGFGLALLALIALGADSYDEALEYSEQSLAVVISPLDQNTAIGAKACALVLLRRTEEGAALLEESRRHSIKHGHLYNLIA